MINNIDIENAFKYYNLDDRYKNRCYECAKNINSNQLFLESFIKVQDILNDDNFSIIRNFWKYKKVDELFCENIDPFVTNLMIVLSYKNNKENLKKYNINEEQININKKRIKECFEKDLIERNYKSVRVSQMLWAFYFVHVKIIEIGRLQYELLEKNNDNLIVKIHIPRGGRLNIEEVNKSIELSKLELKDIYKMKPSIYKCDSWLLSNILNEKIDINSNIHKFYNLFDVVDGEDCTNDILNFVYNLSECNNYEELPEDTKLQKIIKYELMNGTIFNIGVGLLKN